MRRIWVILLLWLGLVGGWVQCEGETWPGVEFSYVKAYMYNLDNKLLGNHAMIKNGKLDGTVVGEGILLTPQQVETVVTLTNHDIGGLLAGLSKSFIPHHGLVFYNRLDQPVAYISLCFDGEGIRVSPEKKGKPIIAELPDQEIKRLLGVLEEYKRIIRELKLPIFNSPFEYQDYPQHK